MIYQCHPDSQRTSAPFGSFYQLFCLDPGTNVTLTQNCPELIDAGTRFALSEYAAMLHCWRNPQADSDSWIGFTSYRQMDKVPFVLQECHIAVISAYDIATWGWLWVGNIGSQAEQWHPGITEAALHALYRFGIIMPTEWHEETSGIFANYWAMRRTVFDEYMLWSWPIVSWLLTNPDRLPFLNKRMCHDNGIGYLMERLLIIWYCVEYKTVFDLVASKQMRPPATSA